VENEKRKVQNAKYQDLEFRIQIDSSSSRYFAFRVLHLAFISTGIPRDFA
jgi:hypothetical protein